MKAYPQNAASDIRLGKAGGFIKCGRICKNTDTVECSATAAGRAKRQALAEENCLVKRLRKPIDPLPLYRTCVEGDSKESAGSSTPQARNMPTRIPMVNRAKIFLISALWRKCSINDIPWAPNRPASAPLFSGVALSGRMDEFSKPLLASFQHEATRQNRDAEILFHPISVPIEKCLDPLNKPFAEACASVSRNHEAELIRKL